MKKGVPVSPGVAVARAFCLDDSLARRDPHHLEDAALSGETKRLDDACNAAAQELDNIIARVSKQIGEDEAAIFRSHRALLRDPALIGKVKANILNRHVDASEVRRGQALAASYEGSSSSGTEILRLCSESDDRFRSTRATYFHDATRGEIRK